MQSTHPLLSAWFKGDVCLHPTDTLPGLSFHPEKENAYQTLCKIKGRPQDKPFVCLVSDLDKALKFWQPLPANWQAILAEVWPAPLTVVWQMDLRVVPNRLHTGGNSIALRVPKLGSAEQWFAKVLKQIDLPFPSTSVNAAGKVNAKDYLSAVAFLQESGRDTYIPKEPFAIKNDLASTVIQLHEDARYSILREGSFDTKLLDEFINNEN